ncbi:MAG TPA: helix-turn-helix domain-containing protein [Acidimicrobiales bacterium]|nr:helix-turn-helix domain-containing protein [Acidimicrobiales bacterium]
MTPRVRRAPSQELVQRQARALGDPTRYDIFRFVAAAEGPVRVATLASYLGFNHNAVRQHLAKLTEAGLLTEDRASPTTTGRPPLEYRVAPTAMGSWGAPGPYEILALMLLEIADGGSTPLEAGAGAGRTLAAGCPDGADPLSVLETEMARRGFEPRRETRGPVTDLVLERCPFLAAATVRPDVVCQIHRGLAAGILDGMGADVQVSDLVVHPPAEAGCRLRLERRPEPAP